MLQELAIIKTALKEHAKFDNKEVEEATIKYIESFSSDLTEAGYMRGEDFNTPFNEFVKILDEVDNPRESKPRFTEVDPEELERDRESRLIEDDEDDDVDFDSDEEADEEDRYVDRDAEPDKL